jgi:hypothetical protein
MNILPCINTQSAEWQQLVAQTNEQLAKDTYATKGGMPNIIEPKEILNFIGLENNIKTKNNESNYFYKAPKTIQEKRSIAEQLSLFNDINESSHSLKEEKSGELSLHMNYLSKSTAIQRQAIRNDRPEQLKFNSSTLGIFEKVNKSRRDFVTDLQNQVADKIPTAVRFNNSNSKFLLKVNTSDDKLSSAGKTYEWGLKIKNYFDTLYDSKTFGSIIELKSTPSGTILNIMPTIKLIDNFESEYTDKINDELIELQSESNNKSEKNFVESSIFINKNVVPKVAKFMLSKIDKIISVSTNDMVAEFGEEAKRSMTITKGNSIFLNREKVTFDAPIRLFAGHLMLKNLKQTNPNDYSNLINLANQTPLKNNILSKSNFLDNESVGVEVFSKLLNDNETTILNKEEAGYFSELNSIIKSNSISLNTIFNKLGNTELNINLNSSLRDILIQLKDDENFLLYINKSLELSKEDIFSDIANQDLKNKLEELNYIQKICKI